MQFVYPAFLFALLAVAIPVIIHLFHFRRFRKVYFPDVSFLEQLSEESKRQARLKHWLVLAARMLAIAFLVLAFAKPYIPSGESQVSAEGNAVAVYIDNSFSMDALARQGHLLDEAREIARQVAGIYQPTDRFLLLTNDFEGRHQHFVSKDEFLTLLGELDLSPAVRTLGEVMQRKNELFTGNTNGKQNAYYVSDYQKSMAVFGEAKPDSNITSFFIPLQAQSPANVFIDSCWFESPVRLAGQAVTLKVRICNDGDLPMENQPLRLFVNEVQRTVASFNIPARGETEESLTWTIQGEGMQQGRIEIVDYPISFDDQLFFSYEVASGIPVLSIDEQGQGAFLRALFGRDSTFLFSSQPVFAVDFSEFQQYNMLVMNGLNAISGGLALEARRYAEQGGHLVIFPGSSAELSSYNEFFLGMGLDEFSGLDTASYRVSTLNDRHQIYTGVFEDLPDNMDLPRSLQHYSIRRSTSSSGQTLMDLQNGDPFFVVYPYGRGKVFLSAVPLSDDFSNFQRHAVFVPTLVNIALQSGSFQPLYHVLGDNQPILVQGARLQRDEVLKLRGPETEVIPEQRRAGSSLQLFVRDQVNQADNYALWNGETLVRGLSFNYDRRESVSEVYSGEELKALLQDQGISQAQVIETSESGLGKALEQASLGRQLWKLFLLLALAALLAETLLLRFMK
ncbi:MAG: BatA domain-containing protein [Bacteroides sp.]|jgi:hypothetical protein|nr:BatA domain-containing protein [Bacteroides sp.]